MSAFSHRSRAAILIAFSAVSAFAGPARGLDRARLHGYYQDGEFERLLEALEAYGKGRCACSRADSLFAEKHLAVVLAANPATRELGRYHMHRLLELAPRADLLDMYVGEEVDAVFEKVRKEHTILSAPAHAPAPSRKQPAAPPRPLSASPRAQARTAPGPASGPASRTASTALNPRPSSGGSDPGSAPSPASSPAGSSVPVTPRYSDAWTVLPDGRSGEAPAAHSRGRTSATPGDRAAAPLPSWDRIPADGSGPGPGAAEPAEGAERRARARDRSGRAEVGAGQGIRETEKDDSAARTSETSRRAWKEAGLWIGGGAALAAVAFTLWQAGSGDGESGKTYAVPASVSR